MTTSEFRIQDAEFSVDTSDRLLDGFSVNSKPRPYDVRFPRSATKFAWLREAMASEKHALLLVDDRLMTEQLAPAGIGATGTYRVEATEANKDIAKVLDVCDFLQEQGANRGSMLFVVGGGILQDLGAFASYLLKRGIPWTFAPTTLLAQGDSCVGGKTAVNHRKTKNLLGLFSAPRRVMIDTDFLATLREDDRLSGCGEIFRLCITGGEASLQLFERELNGFLAHSEDAVRRMIACALAVKQKVVEADEFELDLRRSMNYGHSVGHAVEALSDHAIPHGLGVSFGMLVENQISVKRGVLPPAQAERIEALGRKVIPGQIWSAVRSLSLDRLLPLLASDKKAEGAVLKLATLRSIGDMAFFDLSLDATGMAEVKAAIEIVVQRSSR